MGIVSLHITCGFFVSTGVAAAAANVDEDPIPKPLYDRGRVAGPKSHDPITGGGIISGLRRSKELSVVYGGVMSPALIDCCCVINMFGGGGGGGRIGE